MGIVELLLGVVFAAGLAFGIGFGAMGDASGIEFWVARASFVTSALAVAGAYWWWWADEPKPIAHLVLFGAMAGLWVFVALPMQLAWLGHREARIKALEDAARPKPPPLQIETPTPTIGQPTAAEIAEQVAKLLKGPSSPQLRLELIVDRVRAKDADFRFVATNIGLLDTTVIAWRYSINGEMTAGERPGDLIKREIPPAGRLTLFGLPINDLVKIRNVSVEVEYVSNIDGVNSTFKSLYRFMVPAGQIEGKSIDPIESARATGTIVRPAQEAALIQQFSKPTGTVYFIIPEKHADGSPNRAEIRNAEKYFLYDPSKKQVLFGIRYPDGRFQHALGITKDNEKGAHLISFSWDDAKASMILRVDGTEFHPQMSRI